MTEIPTEQETRDFIGAVYLEDYETLTASPMFANAPFAILFLARYAGALVPIAAGEQPDEEGYWALSIDDGGDPPIAAQILSAAANDDADMLQALVTNLVTSDAEQVADALMALIQVVHQLMHQISCGGDH